MEHTLDDGRLPGLTNLVVTPEMVEAAACLFESNGKRLLFADLYRAMAALAPVELVSEGERQAVRERDKAHGWIRSLEQILGYSPGERLTTGEILRLRQKKQHAEAFYVALTKGEIWHQTVQDMGVTEAQMTALGWVLHFQDFYWRPMRAAPAESKSTHNPFRVPVRDPRRMGP